MSSHIPTPARSQTSHGLGLLAAFLLAVSAVMLAALPAEATSHSVTIKQYAYGPGSLTINQGDTVTWTNKDSVAHDVTVTSGPVSFHSPMLDQGESWSYTFTTAGEYSYICSVHPDMRGSVTAVAKAPAPVPSAHTHSHSESVAPPVSDAHTATGHASHAPSAAPKASKKPSATASPSTAPTTQLATTTLPTTTLNPLLLVAGTSIAVVVFCLLLMASRPRVQEAVPVEDPFSSGPESPN
jgi:plastocyanin